MTKSTRRRTLALLLAIGLVGVPASSFAIDTWDYDGGSPNPVDRADPASGSDAPSTQAAGGSEDYPGGDSDPGATVNDCGMSDPCTPGFL